MLAFVSLKNNKTISLNTLGLQATIQNNVFYKIVKESTHEQTVLETNYLMIGNATLLINKSTDIEMFEGEYSVGEYNLKTQIFKGARDKIGIKPFFYANTKDLFVYSTSIKFIKQLLNKVTVNNEYIERVLSSTAPLFDETFYQEIKRLPPAHELTYANNQITVKKYWSPQIKKDSNQQEFNKFLLKAVKKRTKNIVGSELSGGIDSSGISGILSKQIGVNKLQSFRHVMNDLYIKKYSPFGDEREYSQRMLDFSSNIEINNIDALGKGILNELVQEMQNIGTPFYSGMTLFSDGLYDVAREKGVETLFSGFGGDELVSSSSKYIIRELLNRKRFRELRELTGVNFLSVKNLKYYFRALFPNYKRKKHWREEQLDNHLLNKELNFKEILKNDEATRTFETLNDFLISRIQGRTLLTRLEENGLSARARGIEYTYPLLDVDLIECFLALPSKVKYNHKLPRSVYRNAIKDFTPKEIYTRNNKTGTTVSTVFYRFMNDYDKIMEFLLKYKKGKASEFLNISKMIETLKLIKKKAYGEEVKRIDIRIFIIGLQMILYFDLDVLGDNYSKKRL